MSDVASQADILEALADRCEREEPSRELDEAIALARGWKWVGLSPRYWLEPGLAVEDFQRNPNKYILDPRTHLAMPIRFTASLDAASTIIPPGYIWDVTSTGTAWCMPVYIGEQTMGRAAAPPLALCAALLRMRAAIAKQSDTRSEATPNPATPRPYGRERK